MVAARMAHCARLRRSDRTANQHHAEQQRGDRRYATTPQRKSPGYRTETSVFRWHGSSLLPVTFYLEYSRSRCDLSADPCRDHSKHCEDWIPRSRNPGNYATRRCSGLRTDPVRCLCIEDLRPVARTEIPVQGRRLQRTQPYKLYSSKCQPVGCCGLLKELVRGLRWTRGSELPWRFERLRPDHRNATFKKPADCWTLQLLAALLADSERRDALWSPLRSEHK